MSIGVFKHQRGFTLTELMIVVAIVALIMAIAYPSYERYEAAHHPEAAPGPTVAGDADAVYSLSLANVTQTTWTATAAPLNGQLSRDTACGSLSITQAGAKSDSAGNGECW